MEGEVVEGDILIGELSVELSTLESLLSGDHDRMLFTVTSAIWTILDTLVGGRGKGRKRIVLEEVEELVEDIENVAETA